MHRQIECYPEIMRYQMNLRNCIEKTEKFAELKNNETALQLQIYELQKQNHSLQRELKDAVKKKRSLAAEVA
eukprot:c54760_g1_i1 orf=357-572(-)